jgi:SAM-dependent methyltransferase
VERHEYDKLDQIEDSMWWFAGLHRNLLMLSQGESLRSADFAILDAGCGTGGLLSRIAERYPGRPVVGLDLDPKACERAASKSARPVCAGSVNALPFGDGVFSTIFSADVLCHDGVDECRALQQFNRCLMERGCLVLNLPAYRWMLSRHDVAVSNVRRYAAKGLTELLQGVGFRPVFVTYWNAIMFPFMVLARKLCPGGEQAGSDVRPYNRPVELVCRAATALETAMLRSGVRIPFGGSILAVAVKESSAHD